MISSKTDFTLYWDPNFVSSQQLWLMMISAEIDAKLMTRSILSGEILRAQDDDLPKGLWLPVLRDHTIASEGLMHCFNRVVDHENIKKIRGPAWLDGRAYGLCKKAIDSENHLLLIEGEFLYRPKMRSIRKMAGFYVENIQDDIKAKIMNDIILGRISPKALKLSLEYIHDNLCAINDHLGFQLALNSDEFGLADILWAPVIRRLLYMDWPLENYSEILPWYREVLGHFSALSMLDGLENLPSRANYSFWQKINWLGSRDLKSSLKLMGLDKKDN